MQTFNILNSESESESK